MNNNVQDFSALVITLFFALCNLRYHFFWICLYLMAYFYNGQRKKDKQLTTEHMYKTKDQVFVTLTPLKSGSELRKRMSFLFFLSFFYFNLRYINGFPLQK